MNTERDSAIAALVIAGIDQTEASNLVDSFQAALPEATAEDLTQIALQSVMLRKLEKNLLVIPDELKPFLPHLGPLLEQVGKTMKLPAIPWFGQKSK